MPDLGRPSDAPVQMNQMITDPATTIGRYIRNTEMRIPKAMR